MGKVVSALVLGLLGSSVFSSYPVVGFGMMAVSALLVWMTVQGRRSAQPISHARPGEWARARRESQIQVARQEREARSAVRHVVRQADRRGQLAVQRAAERAQAEQSAGWVQ